MNHFPKDWKCSPELRELYPEFERKMLPIIIHKAKRLRRYVPMDDAIQEGRLALLAAMSRFDYTRGNGQLERFVSVVLNNTFNAMFYEATTQSRMPTVAVRGDGDEWVAMKQPPISIDDVLGLDPADAGDQPDVLVERRLMEEPVRQIRLKMLNMLNGRELDVFNAMLYPSVPMLIMIRNTGGDWTRPTKVHIAQFLGITKNMMDCSLYKIKTLFTKLARSVEHADVFGHLVWEREWPMFHMSSQPKHDVEFIQRVIKERRLNPRPVDGCQSSDDYIAKCNHGFRMVERYDWGVVVVLKRNKQWRTLVVEGEFNPATGESKGSNSANERIPVPWYGSLCREVGAKWYAQPKVELGDEEPQ